MAKPFPTLGEVSNKVRAAVKVMPVLGGGLVPLMQLSPESVAVASDFFNPSKWDALGKKVAAVFGDPSKAKQTYGPIIAGGIISKVLDYLV